MGEITLNAERAMSILNNPDATPDARVIAACTIAFFEANDHAEVVEKSTRAIALKLSHMVAAAIYDAEG